MFGAIMMDTYTLGRMFRKFSDETSPENIIGFFGDHHTTSYLSFIKELDGTISIFEQNATISPDTKTQNQCITIDLDSDKILNFDI